MLNACHENFILPGILSASVVIVEDVVEFGKDLAEIIMVKD